MTGFRIVPPRFQEISTASNVFAGALLFVYENGTTTKVDLWEDRACTVAAENPIEADSAGRFPVRYLDSGDAQLLTVVMRQPNVTDIPLVLGAEIWSDDDIEPFQGVLLGPNFTAIQGRATLAQLPQASGPGVFLTRTTAAAGNLEERDYRVPIQFAASDELTALTTGTNKVRLRAPFAYVITGVRGSLNVEQTSGSVLTVDVNKNGTTILSTKLTFDNGEKTTVTATTPCVISVSQLADDDEISVDIDQIGDGTAKGLKITLLGYPIP